MPFRLSLISCMAHSLLIRQFCQIMVNLNYAQVYQVYICTYPKLGYNPNLIIQETNTMLKLIFLAVLIWLAIYLIKRLINPITKDKAHGTHSGRGENRQESAENMVQCATCHVHLPRSEAFLVDGQFYCCQEHVKK